MKGNSNSKKTTEGQKKEELKNEIRSYLNDYQSINEDTTITENTKMVLSMLLYTGNGQDKFTIGYRYIEEVTGISKNSISPIVGKLEKKGFINRTKGTRGKNSEYTLNYETMESYVSNCPSVQVSKCTTKKHKKGVQVSKCPSVQPNETTCTPTCTLKSTDIQRIIKQNEEKIQLNKRTNELLEKLCNLYINNNINKNLKDNISSNNNTEGNITRDQEKKKNISTGNLEKLKENSKDEIIPSGMKDSSEDNDNISKAKSSNNENLNESRISDLVDMYFNQTNIPNDSIPSESRIPSDEGNISDNENPSDYPPLDVDSLFEFEDDFNPLTEYRTNENLNEENETSMDENSKANGSSKEDGGLSEDKNPSDENPSKTNENPEDDEMDCSVFGDSNSTDEDKDKDNDKWYESSRSAKSDNHENGMFTNLISELTSNENPKANEISNDNNLKTSENMKKTKISKGEISNKSNISNSFIHFGRLVGVCDMKGNVEEYLFNAYDTLKTADDFSEKFTETTEITIDLTQLEVSQDCGSGVWGMLSFNNSEYSFTQSNVNTHYSEKVTQSCAAETDGKATETVYADENTDEVDNYTTDDDITAGNTLKMRPEPSDDNNDTTADNKNDENTVESPSEDTPKTEISSEGNNDTTANDKDDEKAIETVYADEKNSEVDSNTTDKEITAGNSVKIRPEASDEKIDTPTDEKKDEKTAEIPSDNNKEAESQSNDNNAPQASKTSEVGSNTTNIKKIDSTQSQNANKASNAGVLDGLDGETKAMIEELMKRDTAKKVTPMGRDYFKGAPDRWKEIHLKCAYAGGNNGDLLTIEEAIENYSSYESPRLHLDAIRTYAEEICKRMRNVLADNVITQEQFNAFSDVFKFKSEGYKAACAEDFKKNKPTTESEKWMYNWIYKKKNIKN